MKQYLMGISKYCDKLIEQKMIDIGHVDGLFDNSCELCGTKKYGLTIEKPYYDSEAEIIITVRRNYWYEMIKQLLELGYRKFTVFCTKDGQLIKHTYDYSMFDYEKDKDGLVLLYLEHKSYSGISAIDYLVKNKMVDTHGMRVKYFPNDENDEYYYYDMITARYIITERRWKGAEKAQVIQMWHGYPLKAMGNMLADFNEERDGYLEDYWKQFDMILSYGLNYTTFLCACYGTKYKDFVEVGMPRNDLLFVTDGKENLRKVFPMSAGKKIVLYMPTFREISGEKNGDDKGYLFYWGNFSVERLQEFCRKNNIFFVFKLHPSDESKVKEWCVESDCMGVLTDESLGEQAMYEFLNAADVLVTDYSSVYFDYLVLDRPIVFTNQDEESYARNRGFILEPLDFWRPGAVVGELSVFEEAVKRAIEGDDGYDKARAKLMPFVHKYVDGNSTQRLFDFMKSDAD